MLAKISRMNAHVSDNTIAAGPSVLPLKVKATVLQGYLPLRFTFIGIFDVVFIQTI